MRLKIVVGFSCERLKEIFTSCGEIVKLGRYITGNGDETVSTGVWKLRLRVELLALVKRRNPNINADDYKFALAA